MKNTKQKRLGMIFLVVSLLTTLAACDKQEAENKKAPNRASGFPADEELYNRIHENDDK